MLPATPVLQASYNSNEVKPYDMRENHKGKSPSKCVNVLKRFSKGGLQIRWVFGHMEYSSPSYKKIWLHGTYAYWREVLTLKNELN